MPDQTTTEAQAPDPSELQRELDQLAGEKAELQDRVLRAQAEFQNFKKRTERERSELFRICVDGSGAGVAACARRLRKVLEKSSRLIKNT